MLFIFDINSEGRIQGSNNKQKFQALQRQLARRRFNSEPVICGMCSQTNPNYKMFLDKKNKVSCYNCATKSIDHILNIQNSYKQYYHDLIKKLPIPDYKIAKECLEQVNALKSKVDTLLLEVRSKLDQFQKDLNQFFQQTGFICQSYIDKIKSIQSSSVNNWHKQPPKLIDQQKFIYNMKQKRLTACKIQQSLKELQINIPNIDQIKKQNIKAQQKIISLKYSLTAAIKVRGVLYLGTMDGRIIYESGFKQKQIQAHDSLIRVLQYDGQFRLFSGSDDQKIKMWDIRGEDPKLQKTFGSIEGIKSVHRQLVILDNGKSLASSRGQFDEYKIRIWDLDKYQNTKTLDGHNGYIKGMTGTASNKLVSVSQDKYLKIWDIKSSETISQYFHLCKINFVFVNNQSQLICITDETNKILLFDIDTLSLFIAIYVGKKIQLASADSYIYIHADRYLYVYTWNLALIEKIDLGLTYASTNIIQLVNKLIVTDANGVLHQFYPQCLKNINM